MIAKIGNSVCFQLLFIFIVPKASQNKIVTGQCNNPVRLHCIVWCIYMSVSIVDYTFLEDRGYNCLVHLCFPLLRVTTGWCEEDYRRGTHQCQTNKWLKYHGWAFYRQTVSSVLWRIYLLSFRLFSQPVSLGCLSCAWHGETNVVLPTHSLHSRERQATYAGDEDQMWHVDQEAWSGLEV